MPKIKEQYGDSSKNLEVEISYDTVILFYLQK